MYCSMSEPHSPAIFRILPVSIANILGTFLPTFEIALALIIIIGLWSERAALTGTILMVVFVIAISQAWARGLPINCGCFGNGGVTADGKVHNWTYLSEILRDLGLIACGFYIYRFPIGKLALDK